MLGGTSYDFGGEYVDVDSMYSEYADDVLGFDCAGMSEEVGVIVVGLSYEYWDAVDS